MTADKEKLRSLIAHIARKSPKLGKLKLFKLLYLIDFQSYAELGHSVTGDCYENFEMGPVPVTLWKSFGTIMRECANIDSVPTALGSNEQQITARSDFDIVLPKDEIAIADRILAQFGSYSGNSLKELTHKQVPYLASTRGDTIPYGLAGYLFFRPPTEADRDAVCSDTELMERVKGAVLAKRNAAAA